MAARKLTIITVLFTFFILLGGFIYLYFFSEMVAPSFLDRSSKEGENISSFINTRIAKFQDKPDYRTIKIAGQIENSYLDNDYTIVELKLSDTSREAKIKVDFGSDNTTIGVNFPVSEGKVRKNRWSSINLDTFKNRLVKNQVVDVEVVTWVSDKWDCIKDNEFCKSQFDIYKKHEKSNIIIDKFLFQNPDLTDKNLRELTKLEVIGPVNTVSFVD